MRIAVNTRLLIKNKLEGIGWFTYETLKRITTNHPEHEFIFFFDRKYDEEFIFSKNITPVILNPPTRHPVLWYLWFEWSLPSALKKHKADLFFSPDGWLSLRSQIPAVNVIHDLNFHQFPQFIPWHVRNYYYYFFPRFAKKARRIATVSEFSKQDISTRYGIDKNKIDVVYNGANTNFKPLSEDQKKQVQKQYTKDYPFFLFVGLIHPRKNLANLFKAFDLFKKAHSSPIKLLVVGEKKWWTSDIEDAFSAMEYKEEVIFTGRLSNEELQKVTGSALAMTYIPYFEGFGIPILEAFYSDTPVITSNTSSMPEVARNAALLVDPFSPASISEAMIRVATDEKLKCELINKSRIRRLDFSWDKSADLLWQTLEKSF